MATVPRLDIEVNIPKMNFIGTSDVLPKKATEGEVTLVHGHPYVYVAPSWVELGDMITLGGNLIDALMEVLNKPNYKNNSLAKDILDLIEAYKVCGYE